MLPQNQKPSEQVSLRIPSTTPLFTYALLFTLLVIAIAHLTTGGGTDMIQNELGLTGQAVIQQQQYTRLLTALLLLGTPATTGAGALIFASIGIIMSLYTLYSVGIEMEQLWGTPRTLLVYTLGGAFGGAVSLLLIPFGGMPPDLPLATASGGILALLGAQLVYLYKHRRLYRAMVPRRQAFLLVLATLNLIVIAFATHTDFIGGILALLAGGVLAAFISPFMLPRQHPDDPNALLAEDVNPLRGQVLAVTLFTMAIMLLVAVTVNLASV
jgi:membrane associated rhomboid family serine protease